MSSPFGAEQANDGRKQGKEDNDGDHIVNVVADVGDEMAEGITAKDGGSNPEGAAHSIEEQIARIGHFCSSGDRGTKRSNDGDETGENHGAATVFFIEVMGALQMAAAEKEGIFAAV